MYKLRRDETELLQYQLDAELKVLDALDRHYRDAMGTIDDTIAKLMGRGDANLPHVIHQVKYQRALRAQVEATLDLLQSQEYEDISQYMFQSYEDGFIGAMYSMHHQDVPLIIPIDPVQMVEAVQLDSQISEGLNKRLGVDTKKLKKTITSEISRGIASGLMYSDIARNIRNASGIPLRRAKTIARTEAGRIQEKARADAANDAKELGADVVKQWCAVLDGKTRESHRMVDGQIRELEDKFSNGLMYPKAAGGAAKEVINCRCTHLIRAKWALDEDELKTLRERAASHGLHVKDSKAYGQAKAKDFAAFKKNYLKAAETLENTGENGYNTSGGMYRKIGNTGAFSHLSERMSKKHIRRVASEVGIDMAGLSLTIDRNEELLAYNYFGRADPEKIGGITFFPNAFANREELIKTLVHERQHVLQFRQYGVAYVQEHRGRFEKEAEAAENEFIERLKKEGKL